LTAQYWLIATLLFFHSLSLLGLSLGMLLIVALDQTVTMSVSGCSLTKQSLAKIHRAFQ
jgi:hypothetical protein